MEDLNKEVALMFVKHCNDPSLSVVFKSKLADRWTAKEVQERLDEHHRELKTRHGAPAMGRFAQCTSTVVSDDVHVNKETEPENELICHKQSVSQPQRSGELASLQSSIDKMTVMLGEVLSKLSASNKQTLPSHSSQGRGQPGLGACKICNENSHSTAAHCRRYRLCFLCHQSGHVRNQCPNEPSPAALPTSASPVPQGN